MKKALLGLVVAIALVTVVSQRASASPIPTGGSCGNGRCEPPEDCNTCPQDCGKCCGNGRCEPPEDCNSCPEDCGRCH